MRGGHTNLSWARICHTCNGGYLFGHVRNIHRCNGAYLFGHMRNIHRCNGGYLFGHVRNIHTCNGGHLFRHMRNIHRCNGGYLFGHMRNILSRGCHYSSNNLSIILGDAERGAFQKKVLVQEARRRGLRGWSMSTQDACHLVSSVPLATPSRQKQVTTRFFLVKKRAIKRQPVFFGKKTGCVAGDRPPVFLQKKKKRAVNPFLMPITIQYGTRILCLEAHLVLLHALCSAGFGRHHAFSKFFEKKLSVTLMSQVFGAIES